MYAMRPYRSFLVSVAAFVIAASFAVPRAEAAFFAVSRAISRADELLEQGFSAEAEGRRKEAFDFYDKALSRYADIHRDHPDARPDYVTGRMAECRSRMLAMFAAAEEHASPATALPAVPVGSPQTTDLPQNEVAPLPSESGAPAVRRPPRAEARNETHAPGASLRRTPYAEAHDETPGDEIPAPEAIGDDQPLERRIAALLTAGRAAEAVLLMDAAVGDAPDEAPLVHRLLLARSLVAAGNIPRAIAILDVLVREFPDDPAVLTLTAGAHLAHGNAFSALRALDVLVKRYPRYADAYVDLAYTRFAMDPDANRDEAVLYYKYALSYGAERDPRLEAELGVEVTP